MAQHLELWVALEFLGRHSMAQHLEPLVAQHLELWVALEFLGRHSMAQHLEPLVARLAR